MALRFRTYISLDGQKTQVAATILTEHDIHIVRQFWTDKSTLDLLAPGCYVVEFEDGTARVIEADTFTSDYAIKIGGDG
jgi:hypothetical protein